MNDENGKMSTFGVPHWMPKEQRCNWCDSVCRLKMQWIDSVFHDSGLWLCKNYRTSRCHIDLTGFVILQLRLLEWHRTNLFHSQMARRGHCSFAYKIFWVVRMPLIRNPVMRLIRVYEEVLPHPPGCRPPPFSMRRHLLITSWYKPLAMPRFRLWTQSTATSLA